MFERWTERARTVVVLAQDYAREMKHCWIGTEHLLYGLAAEEQGLGAKSLAEHDVTPGTVRADVERIVGIGKDEIQGQIPFTPRAKKVCELSLREALALGCNYIGTEHILLGLVRENEGVGARILNENDVDSEKVRNTVVRLLSGPKRPAPAPRKVDPRPLTEAADHALEALKLVNAEIERRARENDEISLSPSAHQLRTVVAQLSQFAKSFETA